MIRDPERFKSTTEGIKNIVFTIAAIIAGGWAVLEFDLLRKVDKANYELEELRQKIEQEPNIEIQIESNQAPAFDNSKGYQLLGVARIKNDGNKEASLHFSQESVTVSKIDHDAKGEVKYGPIMRYKLENQLVNYKYVTVLPGKEPFAVPFVFFLKEPGLYSIVFRVVVPKKEAADKESASLVDSVSYSRQVLVSIGDSRK